MASTTQLPKADGIIPANANNRHVARSQQGYRTIEPASSPVAKAAEADDVISIDDILSSFLIYILPASFFSGIIVLGTMLISYTIVMRTPLPRLFALIIVIVFAGLIMITFFFLMVFHFRRRRSQRRLSFQRVRFTLSETSSVAGGKSFVSGAGAARSLISHVSCSRSAEISQISLLNVTAEAAVAALAAVRQQPPTSSSELTAFVNAQEQDNIPIPAIPLLRRVKCYANIKQAAQNQDQDQHQHSNNNDALVVALHQESTTGPPLHHNSAARTLPSSFSTRYSSLLENNTISGVNNQWPLVRPSLLTIQPATAAARRHAQQAQAEEEEAIYYLPPGPPSPVPISLAAGIRRPIWADDIERQINANQQASETPGKHHRKWPK